MKRFMYLSISILCLSLSLMIGFHFGVRSAGAQIADPSPTGTIVVVCESPQNRLSVLNRAGEYWELDGSGWVGPITGLAPLPVSVFDIKYWSEYSLITESEEGWYWDGVRWRSAGPAPGPTSGVVPVESTTWGQLKGKYEEDK